MATQLHPLPAYICNMVFARVLQCVHCIFQVQGALTSPEIEISRVCDLTHQDTRAPSGVPHTRTYKRHIQCNGACRAGRVRCVAGRAHTCFRCKIVPLPRASPQGRALHQRHCKRHAPGLWTQYYMLSLLPAAQRPVLCRWPVQVLLHRRVGWAPSSAGLFQAT